MNAYFDAMRRYADFHGRSTRAQFWVFQLVVSVLAVVSLYLDYKIRKELGEQDLDVVFGIVVLAHVIPGVALMARRLHDASYSGWWVLANFVPLANLIVFVVMGFIPSVPGDTIYGLRPTRDKTPPTPSSYRQPNFAAEGHPAQRPMAPVAPERPGTAPAKAPPPPDTNLIDKLERLSVLRTSGAIDEPEFQRMKADLLQRAAL